jgi:hypothetical protein
MSTSIDLAALERHLRQHVENLARTPRAPGSAEHRRAARYVADHFTRAGFVVEESPFNEAGFSGTNLLTRPLPERSGSALVIVGAHYDSLPDTPGADDNASAVAALLELASWIGPQLASDPALANRLQLAAYDLEEWGLIGSFVHSREFQRSGVPLRGMISLEMLGYTDHRPHSQGLPPQLAPRYPHVGNFIGLCANDDSMSLLQVVTQAMKTIQGLPVECLAVPGKGELLPEVRLSDHNSFWDRDYPALMITDTSFFRNPHYHQRSDTPETLDYSFLARVTAGVFAAVSALLRS